MNREYILGKLTQFNGTKRLLVNDQQVPDIMSAMLSAHKIYSNEYDKISEDFYGGNGVQSAEKIFNFLKKNIKYKIESDKNQRIMSPGAIVSLAKNDCKNYSLFAAGILDSLKRKGLIDDDIYFRFASYRLLDVMPHHVFVVLKDKNGFEYWIDPVLNTFNERKMYYHKIDKKVNGMPLYAISGVGSTIGAAKDKPKEKKKIVLKIALAPARGAFLLLVGLNFMGLATKIKNAFDNRADATQNWWKNLGGNPNELLKKTEQGAAKKRLLGQDVEFPSEGQIGVVAAGTAAATATAAPILIKIAEFLRSIGIDPKDIAEVGKEILAKKIKGAVESNLEAEYEIEQASNEQVREIVDSAENAGKTNYIPILIGGALVLYFVTRKK